MNIRIALFFTLLIKICVAQQPKKPSSTDIFQDIQKLNTLASVLYVAAHPDDENQRLISYVANQLHARSGYLSLTRGDGGQNLIGSEIRELLGVLRTQELLAARHVDGGEQLFSRANDFGFSKHPDETFDIWNKKEVLADVVRAIRKFKPDVIINRFNHRTPGKSHGHHTASALLSIEAFNLSNDKSAYPNQLNTLGTWQPKRLFFNTSWWWYGSKEKFKKEADFSKLLELNVGVYYPLKGLSNNELAAIARSQHLCQGFGRLTDRGNQNEYLEIIKGDFPTNNNIFEGIDTSWNRTKGGKAIGKILNKVEKNFNFKNPAQHIPELLKAYSLIQKLEDTHWKTLKSKEIKTIIEACSGLYLEASAKTPTATLNSTVDIDIEALNRSNTSVVLESIQLGNNNAISKNKTLALNDKLTFDEPYTIPTTSTFTSPYWLTKEGTLGMYNVDDANQIGNPESNPALHIAFHLKINGTPLTITKVVVHRFSKPDKGELYKPFEIVPDASVAVPESMYIFNNDSPKTIEITVTAHKDNLKGTLDMGYPRGWQIIPESHTVSIAKKGDSKKLSFTITPPSIQSEGYITPGLHSGDKTFSKTLHTIDYNHIPLQTVLLPCKSKLVRLDIKKKGNLVGYIEGAGDVVPQSLEQMGYKVEIIAPETITNAASLQKYDAIVIGIRAYNTIDALKFKQDYLLDYVKNGGTMVVQYNTNRNLKVDNLGPYPLKLSRDRVTDEFAKVTFTNPNHKLLNAPNKITADDFNGWVQERGLYFPNEWADKYETLLEMNDKGETAKKGSLLYTKYGKGHYILTGLSFFREFPAGVSGAYRLFANLISVGQN